MDNLWEAIDTLTRESEGGGVIPSESLAAQGIRAVALFLDNGQIAFIPCKGGGADD